MQHAVLTTRQERSGGAVRGTQGVRAARGSQQARAVRFTGLGAAAIALTMLAGCATGAADSGADSGAAGQAGASGSNTVTLAVHSSFPNDAFAKAASAATGYDVEVVAAGDGGELTNKLVLTQGAPIADAFFGVDTMFASRLVERDVVEPYAPKQLPAGAAEFAIAAESAAGAGTGAGADASTAEGVQLIAETGMVPVDFGATCVNIDTGWFAEHDIAAPETYEDLVKPQYRDQTVLLDPTASSTGAAFLVGTVAAFGEDGYVDYWQALLDNGARIEQGWSDAYYGQFTQGGEGGTKPIVVSYASSPAFTVNEAGDAASTQALLGTCTRQAEYAGVLANAANPEGARAVVDYLVSNEFQRTIPDTMYMNPVDGAVELPAAWAQFAPEPTAQQAHDLSAAEIERGREGWLRTLGDEIGL
ncbi:thiamine transport system substrate-binding protein [Leucobacter exalbidus]|uniref:Thiamine transport system substrate-binding protein n=1 Tax=Leucobacter exalbidus TaxID=662960 RepID=A0A940PV20_9MICO|nr:thiamine ABC transporter substrate-binding protein [Leucobacter exalbidus]MBP1327358.1 thiamine transport system substrate-binding protein [Leucobacter exalbidus]